MPHPRTTPQPQLWVQPLEKKPKAVGATIKKNPQPSGHLYFKDDIFPVLVALHSSSWHWNQGELGAFWKPLLQSCPFFFFSLSLFR